MLGLFESFGLWVKRVFNGKSFGQLVNSSFHPMLNWKFHRVIQKLPRPLLQSIKYVTLNQFQLLLIEIINYTLINLARYSQCSMGIKLTIYETDQSVNLLTNLIVVFRELTDQNQPWDTYNILIWNFKQAFIGGTLRVFWIFPGEILRQSNVNSIWLLVGLEEIPII